MPDTVGPAVKARDRLRCRWCGRTDTLHVHHIAYRSEGRPDHREQNLIVLCLRHHDLVHSNKRRYQPLCRAYIWLLYVQGQQRYLPEIERQLTAA